MEADRGRQAMAAIGLLADEPRQRLYRFVRAQPTPVTRDQAAAAAGISRKLAAFHLAKLVSAGLLETAAPDPASRRPGPGRPQGLPAGRDRGGHQRPAAPLRRPRRGARPGDRRRGAGQKRPHTAQQLEQLAVATGTGESSHPA